jgi:uncharacterized protein (TIGR00106 family)
MLAALSVSPMGAPSDSVGDVVADCVRIVRQSGLPNETNAMFTNIEGEWDEVMAVLKVCADRVLEHAPRVSMVVKLDIRPGHQDMLGHKVERVEKALGERR